VPLTGSPALSVETALLRSGTAEKPQEHDDCGTDCRPWIIEKAGELTYLPIQRASCPESELAIVPDNTRVIHHPSYHAMSGSGRFDLQQVLPLENLQKKLVALAFSL
jgi:hypothetical protein